MSDEPAGLGDRGRRMWVDSLAIWSLTPAHLVLLEEACRIADRLEWLDSILRAVTGNVKDDPAQLAEIPALLGESRQQSAALKALLAEIRQGQYGPSPATVDPTGGAGVSDLTARIARKQASG
ncbi:hypothetical protein ACIQRE_01665 [Streptomyces griseoluteus]|uniref:hypothetical protein n=1 Tax=Streptomyces griseoluteus TaxID=29306 RepID=UPI0038139050